MSVLLLEKYTVTSWVFPVCSGTFLWSFPWLEKKAKDQLSTMRLILMNRFSKTTISLTISWHSSTENVFFFSIFHFKLFNLYESGYCVFNKAWIGSQIVQLQFQQHRQSCLVMQSMFLMSALSHRNAINTNICSFRNKKHKIGRILWLQFQFFSLVPVENYHNRNKVTEIQKFSNLLKGSIYTARSQKDLRSFSLQFCHKN